MKIRRLGATGDAVQELCLEEAKPILEEAIDGKYHLIYDEDGKQLVTKKNLNQLTENSRVTIIPAVRGG